jgi:hypothetical protein
MTDKTKSKPVPTIRAGTLELAMWKNDGEPKTCAIATLRNEGAA